MPEEIHLNEEEEADVTASLQRLPKDFAERCRKAERLPPNVPMDDDDAAEE